MAWLLRCGARMHLRTCASAVVLALGVASCASTAEDVEDLGELGDGKSDTVLPREVAIDLAPGEAKRIRVKTAAFVASLTQSGDVAAQITAKHLELESTSDVTAEPQLDVEGDGAVRNWTIRVDNLGDAQLQGTLVVDLPAISTSELGIVSDIDKTVMPPETAAGLVPPYPGIASVLTTLELRANGVAGDVYYVTARDPSRIAGVPEWMQMYGVPAGPIDRHRDPTVDRTGRKGRRHLADLRRAPDPEVRAVRRYVAPRSRGLQRHPHQVSGPGRDGHHAQGQHDRESKPGGRDEHGQ